MAIDLKTTQDSINLTKFFGGVILGPCLQFTSRAGRRLGAHWYVTIAIKDLKAFVADCQQVIDGTEEEVDQETEYLLAAANREHLLESIDQLTPSVVEENIRKEQ